MRKLRVWGMAAALSLGVALHAGAADGDDPTKPPPTPGLFSRWFQKPPSPQDAKKELDHEFEARDAKATRDLEAAQAKAREEHDKLDALKARDRYLRQEKVLDRIEKIASEAGDQETLARIEPLRDRAWALYLKITTQTPKVEVHRVDNNAFKKAEKDEKAETPASTRKWRHAW